MNPGCPVPALGRTLFIGLLALAAANAADTDTATQTLTLTNTDRIMILAPHPDDEVIACGGVIQKAAGLGIPVQVVFLTYGDNNEWAFMLYRKHAVIAPSAVRQMGLIRHDEAVCADGILGLSTNSLVFLGYPDFRTLALWTRHWGDRRACESMLTRATAVPYANAYRPGAPYKGEEVLHDLVRLMSDFKPSKVFVPHPADFNTDHQALYLFSQVAMWNLPAVQQPAVFPYLVHFPKWPSPRRDNPSLPETEPAALDREIAWRQVPLSESETHAKRLALQAHKSQYGYAAHYLLSFVRANELFGNYPDIDLAASPETHGKSWRDQGHRYAGDEPGQLTDEERSRFVGIEWKKAALSTNAFVATITLSRPLAETVSASVSCFGWRADTPFEKMPKIRVEVGAVDVDVYDQDRQLPDRSVKVTCTMREIEVVIPLELLGRPQRLLTNARTYLAEIPLDWAAWRVVNLR